jgi:large subunit ribosomal protein L25
MSNQFEITAETRQDMGKGASRRLRRLESVPGIIYGGGEPAQALTLNHRELKKALENEAFHSHILTLAINGKKQKAVLKDLQVHPFKPRVLHMDFLRITGKEKIHMQIPLHFKGDDIAPGVKDDNGVVSHLISSVEVVCLPDNLPEFIEVDLSHLKLDEIFHLSDLKLPKGVELTALAHGNDQPVASIHIPRIIEEPVEAPVAVEVPASEQTAAPEGSETSEGKPAGKEEK